MKRKYSSEILFIEIWNVIIHITEDCDIFETKNLLIKKFEKIENMDLKRLFVFISDEYLINIFKKNWCDNLLEMYFFNTFSGGKLFFDNLDFFIRNRNVEMIKLYILAIKLGFKGNKINPLSEYSKVIDDFFQNEEEFNKVTPYKSIKITPYNSKLIYIFIPIIIIIIFGSFWELILIKIISPQLTKAINTITQEVII